MKKDNVKTSNTASLLGELITARQLIREIHELAEVLHECVPQGIVKPTKICQTFKIEDIEL